MQYSPPMNEHVFMAVTLLLMLSVVVLTPFIKTENPPVIFYENPSLVIDYVNTSSEFRIYVFSLATNVRYQTIFMNITNGTTGVGENSIINNTCMGYLNTTWQNFTLNVTVFADNTTIYDMDLSIELRKVEEVENVVFKFTKDARIEEIKVREMPYAIQMERRW
jgi:hypothetical protein